MARGLSPIKVPAGSPSSATARVSGSRAQNAGTIEARNQQWRQLITNGNVQWASRPLLDGRQATGWQLLARFRRIARARLPGRFAFGRIGSVTRFLGLKEEVLTDQLGNAKLLKILLSTIPPPGHHPPL